MKNAEDFLKECKKDKNFRMSTDTVSDEIMIAFATGYADFKLKNHGVIGDVIFSCEFIEHKTQDSDICAKCGQHRLDHE